MVSNTDQQLDHMMIPSALTDRTRPTADVAFTTTDRSPRARSASPTTPIPTVAFRHRTSRLSAFVRRSQIKIHEYSTLSTPTTPRTPFSDLPTNGFPNMPTSSRRLRRVKRFEISPSADFSVSATPSTSPTTQAAEEHTTMPAWMEDLRACDDSLENDKENLEGFVTRLFGRDEVNGSGNGLSTVIAGEMDRAYEESDGQTWITVDVEGVAHSPLHRRGGSGDLRAEFVRGN
ncbi:hypothetical protein TI39_contig840g00005 [Zymoseptoria brevis]|uniref:Uncharacterized protein n=1 Tax=Zymoseptoria brevis TaxID=1047168 RepID=A0A0F4GF64_9PEZI|nr:hypothetical protein TI39_contig840g00005 [Zymoseptoria brevis]